MALSAAAFFSISVALQRTDAYRQQQPQQKQQQQQRELPLGGVAAALQRVYVSEQTLEDSLLLLRAAAAANPRDAAALMMLAAVALYTRDYREAEIRFEQLLLALQPLLTNSSSSRSSRSTESIPAAAAVAEAAAEGKPLLLRPPHLLPAALLCGEDATALFSCFREAQHASPLLVWPTAVAASATVDAETQKQHQLREAAVVASSLE